MKQKQPVNLICVGNQTTMAKECWRLIKHAPASGAWNMEVDVSLMQSATQGGPPTLRFYAWQPAALSLGYNQKEAVVDKAACKAAGVDVVRRPTGGRAVLHANEVTYAIVLPAEHPIAQLGIVASYRELSRGFVTGFQRLGLPSELAQPERDSLANKKVTGITGAGAACFDAPSWYELAVGGRKVVGSAQVRRRGALLQHGSIPLTLDGLALYQLLAFNRNEAREAAARMFNAKAAGLCDVAGRQITAEQVMAALVEGISRELGVQFEQGDLSPQELASAMQCQEAQL